MKTELKLKLALLPLLIVGCAAIEASGPLYTPQIAVIDAHVSALRDGVDLDDEFDARGVSEEIKKADCPCGDSCNCPAGTCPNCPEYSAPAPLESVEDLTIPQIDVPEVQTFREGLTIDEYIAAYYRRPWTYPGAIEPHLRSHGVSDYQMAGLSHSRKEQLHAAIHERQEGTARLSTVSRVPKTPVVLAQNCPNGMCPAPTQSFQIMDGRVPQAPRTMQNCPNGMCPMNAAPYSMGQTKAYSNCSSGRCSNSTYSKRSRTRRSGPIRGFIRCLFGGCR